MAVPVYDEYRMKRYEIAVLGVFTIWTGRRMDGQTDEQTTSGRTDAWTDRRADGRMDTWTGGRTHGHMDGQYDGRTHDRCTEGRAGGRKEARVE